MTGVRLPRPVLVVVAVGLGVCGSAALLWLVGPGSSEDEKEPIQWSAPQQVVAGGGHRGPWRMNASNWEFVDDPTVAVGPQGTTRVAWTDHTTKDLQLQSYGPGPNALPKFDQPTNISQTPETFSWLPRMVVSERDPATLYVLWQEIIFSGGTHGGEILFTRSTDGGRSFVPPKNLSNSPAGDGKGRLSTKHWHNGSLDLALGPDGTIYAVWTEYEGRLWIVRSTDGGRTFLSPLHVSGTQDQPARGPSVATDPSGRVHLAWTVGETPRADVQYARSPDTTLTFDTPQTVNQSPGYSDAPTLAIDSTGTVHLAYGERPTDADASPHIRYTRRVDDSGFAPAAVLSRRAADSYRGAQFPTLRVTDTEMVIVVWELFPPARSRPDALGYTTSRDRGTSFSRPRTLPGTDTTSGTNGSQQGFLMEKLAVNETGAIAVVNSTFEANEASHIWLYYGALQRQE